MTHQPPAQAFGPPISRVGDLMAHSTAYAFKGVARLARDAGVSPSTVSRILNGKMNPSFLLVCRLTAALEAEFGQRIDPRELIAESGGFLTPNVCDVTLCGGCLPDEAFDDFGGRTPAFEDLLPGHWVSSKYPNGFKQKKGAG